MLREERQARSITAKELSLKLRLDKSYVSRVERGYRTLDAIELIDLLQAMEVDAGNFFARLLERIRAKA
ncbi:MAG TPA: helix-turn-helix transcriptional regulator [Fimbriimonadaceae bacterium]|nr:helix-turn-helix transcriptional regulator [Fimbriimonadaceae bacterium]